MPPARSSIPPNTTCITASSWKPSARTLAIRAAELQGLMAKADSGAAGPVVAEFAYRNDFITARAQYKLADENWRRNKCQETPPAAAAPATPPPADTKKEHRHQHSGSGL